VYGTLLDLGPSTGYAVAHAAGFARANAYAALESLVRRGAALRAAGKPTRFRAIDPQALLMQMAAEQGQRLEELGRALAGVRAAVEPVTRSLEGLRATANVVQQLVARAERSVEGVLGADLLPPTIPAWRHASSRATLHVSIAGGTSDVEGLNFPAAASEHPTLLVVDGTHMLTATRSGETLIGMWSSHPLLIGLARMALRPV
jgi:sugar-specific transcriptional regulator TrmB